MKAISIQQPWGSLICAGLKDVENRSWPLKSTPMRLLIHVGAKRQKMNEDNMPLVWFLPVDNAQIMGILGNIDELPTSAIIGVATVERCDEENFSIWAQEGHGAEYKWVMRDVQLFKEPILGVKGKLGIFDVPGIDENNLPECVSLPKIERDGKHLRIPVCREIFDQLNDGDANELALNLTDANLPLFATKSLKPKPTESVTIYCGDDVIEANVANYEICGITENDSDEDPIEFEDAFERTYYWYKVFITIE